MDDFFSAYWITKNYLYSQGTFTTKQAEFLIWPLTWQRTPDYSFFIKYV